MRKKEKEKKKKKEVRGSTSFENYTTVETTEGYTPLPEAVSSIWENPMGF